MNIIVDTNIVFSAIITGDGKIAKLLLNKPAGIRFFSPAFLLKELKNHSEKLLRITKYNESEYEQIRNLVTKHIEFIESGRIAPDNWDAAFQLTKDVDEGDAAFLALNIEIDGLLWSGDKKLIKGLQNKDYYKIITTDILYNKCFG